MLRPDERTVTQKNLAGNADNSKMPFLVVSDGDIIKDELKLIKTDENTIKRTLNKKKIRLKDVFIMTMDSDGNTDIILKEKK